jgi:hypothetical protein
MKEINRVGESSRKVRYFCFGRRNEENLCTNQNEARRNAENHRHRVKAASGEGKKKHPECNEGKVVSMSKASYLSFVVGIPASSNILAGSSSPLVYCATHGLRRLLLQRPVKSVSSKLIAAQSDHRFIAIQLVCGVFLKLGVPP